MFSVTFARGESMRYRKRPVEVEARQLKKRDFMHVAEWCNGMVLMDGRSYSVLIIMTLEGKMKAQIGDWIIKGVNGEFYPCKPDIFEKTYEKV